MQSEKARRHSDPTVQIRHRQGSDVDSPAPAPKKPHPMQTSFVPVEESPTESELMSGDDFRLTSLHSTSTALHYSSSESDVSPRSLADLSRGALHLQDDIKQEVLATSRPTTPLMTDNNDSFLIRDFEDDDLLSDRAVPRNATPLPPSSKPFKKSHRRSHSDNTDDQQQQQQQQHHSSEKKSKRRSMVGLIVNFLKSVCYLPNLLVLL